MPRPRKLLPRPCPKCHQKYGTIQLVVFNNTKRYWTGKLGYVILRIGHYSVKKYEATRKRVLGTKNINLDLNLEIQSEPKSLIKKGYGRIWHDLRVHNNNISIIRNGKKIYLEDIFKLPDFANKESKTFRITNEYYEYLKRNGYPIFHDRGHWKTKVDIF